MDRLVTDFVVWLRAQLDDDERGPRSLSGESWSAAEEVFGVRRITVDYATVMVVPAVLSVRAEHIARWDPARVLAEVDAKRRIIDEHYVATGYDGHRADADVCGRCAEDDQAGGSVGDPWPCTTLRLLALPYSGRPGYRQEWRPPPSR